MRLTLMCQDREVATFAFDASSGEAADVRLAGDASLSPLACDLASEHAARDLSRFMARRSLPPARSDVAAILAALDSPHPVELALRARGMSLCDPYWYREDDDHVSWQDLNFFDKGWDDAFGRAVLERDWQALARASALVPDVTCGGLAPKAWLATDAGPRLYKGALTGGGLDTVGEVAAAALLSRLLPADDFVPYELVCRARRYLSSSPVMLGPDEELAPARAFLASARTGKRGRVGAAFNGAALAAYAAILDTLGVTNVTRVLARLTVGATLALLADVHPGNYGVIRNVRTGSVRPAPLFDFGGSFLTATSERGLAQALARPHLLEALMRRMAQMIDVGWDLGWYDPRALDGFDRTLRDDLLGPHGLSRDHVALACDLFCRQRERVNHLVASRAPGRG